MGKNSSRFRTKTIVFLPLPSTGEKPTQSNHSIDIWIFDDEMFSKTSQFEPRNKYAKGHTYVCYISFNSDKGPDPLSLPIAWNIMPKTWDTLDDFEYQNKIINEYKENYEEEFIKLARHQYTKYISKLSP